MTDTAIRFLTTAERGTHENTAENAMKDFLDALGAPNCTTLEEIHSKVQAALHLGKAGPEWQTAKYWKVTIEEVEVPTPKGR